MAEVGGLRDLERYLRRLPGELARAAGVAAVAAAAEDLRAAVVARAPVGTGEYRSNVKVLGPSSRGPVASAAVAVDAADFPHPGEPAAVEYGTADRPADAPMRRAADEEGPRAAAAAVRAFEDRLRREL